MEAQPRSLQKCAGAMDRGEVPYYKFVWPRIPGDEKASDAHVLDIVIGLLRVSDACFIAFRNILGMPSQIINNVARPQRHEQFHILFPKSNAIPAYWIIT
jgi:hypothetical protein